MAHSREEGIAVTQITLTHLVSRNSLTMRCVRLENLALLVFSSVNVNAHQLLSLWLHLRKFLAGAIGGYIVWGRYSGLNYQLLLYLISRIIVGCFKLAKQKGMWRKLTFTKTYPWAAAGIWGAVMVMFEECPEILHPSLRRSMEEIYRYSVFGLESPNKSGTRWPSPSGKWFL